MLIFFHKMMQQKEKKRWWNSFSWNLWEFQRIANMIWKRKSLLKKGNCKIQFGRTWDQLDSWREIHFENSNEQLVGFILRRVKSSRCNRVLGKSRYDTWLAVLLWVGIMKSVGKFKTMKQAARLQYSTYCSHRRPSLCSELTTFWSRVIFGLCYLDLTCALCCLNWGKK